MKRKNILKKDSIRFCKDAAEMLARLGFEPFPPDVPPYDCHSRDLRIQTDLGVFIVHPPTMDCWFPSPYEDINGRFPDTSVFGEWGSPERKVADALDISLPSGKWNILHSDPAAILAEFERRMKRVNARPPSPEEREAWRIADEAEAVKLAAWRANMDEFVKNNPVTP